MLQDPHYPEAEVPKVRKPQAELSPEPGKANRGPRTWGPVAGRLFGASTLQLGTWTHTFVHAEIVSTPNVSALVS